MAGKPGCRVGNTRIGNSYQNGVLTSTNGYFGTGLLCNKGERLYDTSVIKPVFNIPEDTDEYEYFVGLSDYAAPGVMPYYAISNYGRIINKYSGLVLKENIRPTGYGYYCLASEKGQTKYTSHVMIAKSFLENDNEDKNQINHINGNKLDNYINKRMDDGTIESNLEWVTPKENIRKAYDTGLKQAGKHNVLSEDDVRDICERLQNNESLYSISKLYSVAYGTISLIKHRRTWSDISCNYDF